MAEHFELTDELKATKGQESAPWTYEVTTTSVRAFARGVGYTDPVYFDVDAAKGPALVEAIGTAGGKGAFEPVNVAESSPVEAGVAAVVARWGRIDVLVNNAGILRDAQLVKWKDGAAAATMSDEAWEAVIGVNLRGVFHCTRAVVPHMIRQGKGVILNASSVVGLYGNFGQTNYAAAKLGVVGFMLALKEEGARYGILAKAIAPLAVTRLGAGVFPDELAARLIPDHVVPVVTWLASDQCTVSGEIVLAGAGRVARAELIHGRGIGSVAPFSPEVIGRRWSEIASTQGGRPFPNINDA